MCDFCLRVGAGIVAYRSSTYYSHPGPAPTYSGGYGTLGLGWSSRVPRERGGKFVVSEEGSREVQRDTARRALQAAAVEAFGRPGAYVTRDLVMRRAGMTDSGTFVRMAGDL